MAKKKAAKSNPVPTGPDGKSESEYRDEDDHRTVMRAEDIREDPARLAGVKRHHRKTMRTLSRMSRVIGSRGLARR